MIIATDVIAEALARVAEALHVPVLVLALAALLGCALEVGRFGVEIWKRTRSHGATLQTLAKHAVEQPDRARFLAPRAPSRVAAHAVIALARAASGGTDSEAALADYELAVQRTLDRTRILVRAGPALGLMGTLIPLAPGLTALGRGDVTTLAGDLRTAFAATVVGLLVGTVAYALTLIRTRMYTEDLVALERVTAATRLQPVNASAVAATPVPPREPV
jgi:biopolymer transport protein ExbB/TolQ